MLASACVYVSSLVDLYYRWERTCHHGHWIQQQCWSIRKAPNKPNCRLLTAKTHEKSATQVALERSCRNHFRHLKTSPKTPRDFLIFVPPLKGLAAERARLNRVRQSVNPFELPGPREL